MNASVHQQVVSTRAQIRALKRQIRKEKAEFKALTRLQRQEKTLHLKLANLRAPSYESSETRGEFW